MLNSESIAVNVYPKIGTLLAGLESIMHRKNRSRNF